MLGGLSNLLAKAWLSFFLFIKTFIAVYLIYNDVLVSAVQ